MGVVIPVGYGLVAWELTLVGDQQPMYVTCGVELDLAGQATADALQTGAGDVIARMTNEDYVVEKAILTTATQVFESAEDPIQGVQTDNVLPQNCAAIIRKNTGIRGRSNRGRFYVPGQPESQVQANGVLNAGYVADLTALADELYADMQAAEGIADIVVLHSEGVALDPTPVISFSPDTVIATQRRRLR